MALLPVAPPVVSELLDTFALRGASGHLERVDGGWTHRLWRLRTRDGVFAVKQFLHDERPGLHQLRRAARYEIDVWNTHTVTMPGPRRARDGRVIVDDCRLADGSRGWVRVHAWAEGRPVPGGVPCSRDMAHRVGSLLRCLHGAVGPDPDDRVAAHQEADAGAWKPMADRLAAGHAVDSEWIRRFHALVPFIVEMQQMARDEAGPTVLSHGDVNQTNCLMDRRGGLTLLDWDDSGPTTALHDVGVAALEWAGAGRGQPDLGAIRALLDGYADAGGVLNAGIGPLLATWVVGSGHWMRINAEIVASPQGVARERLEGARFQLGESLEKLERASASWGDWVRALS